MKIVDVFSHRNGQDILESPKFSPAFKEFMNVLSGLPPYRAAQAKKTSPAHVIAPAAMNHWLDNELCVKLDWDWHPLIIDADPEDPGLRSQLRSDFQLLDVGRVEKNLHESSCSPPPSRPPRSAPASPPAPSGTPWRRPPRARRR